MRPEQIVNEALTSPIYRLIKETPLQHARRLSKSLDCHILLKREDTNPMFSFKVRGAAHKILKIPEAKRARGVVAASAGNHAQGVGYIAQRLGIPAHIFLPDSADPMKIEAIRSLGVRLALTPSNIVEAIRQGRLYATKHKLPFVHPFDDYDIICGQATVGAELVREMYEPVEAVFVCCGGGGLLAGTATLIKNLRPKVKVFGVEPDDAASMTAALAKGKPVTLPYVGTFADTLAVPRIGDRTLKLCQQYVDGMFTVDSGAICNAIKDVYEDTRTIVEPSGAVSVAAARRYAQSSRYKGGTLVALISGANMNFDSLRYVVERMSTGHGKEMLLAAEIPEQPGSFMRLCKLLGHRPVTEFNYRYSPDSPAHILCGIAIKEESERRQLVRHLADNKIKARDLTGDETTELHIRHMVGGRAPLGDREQLYRLEFPERTGALEHFLRKLKNKWNITLFHYRFNSVDAGRVLVGFDLPVRQHAELERTLRSTGYPYWKVESSTAYKMFLAGVNSSS